MQEDEKQQTNDFDTIKFCSDFGQTRTQEEKDLSDAKSHANLMK